MDISTAYKQHQQIIILQNDLAEVMKEIRITEWAYRLAFVATFVVYFVFVWMMYVSDLWGFTTWLIENLSEIAALIIYTVLAVTLPLSMAMIKEIGYKHFAKYRNNWAIVGLIVFILAFAGVVYESISSSSQQQHISTSAAEKSKTFEVITNTSTGSIHSGSMASLIADAQKQLARCEEKLKDGREPHCKGDAAKLQGYIDSEQRAMDSAERAATAAIEIKTKALKELKEDSYKPAFKAIRDSFGVTISTGVMLVTTFISVIFEISHLLLILFLSQKLRRKDWLTQSIINLEAAYLNATGKAFKAEDFTDDTVLNMQDVREQSPAQMGFGIPAHAQFKYQQEAQQPVGFIRTDQLNQSKPNQKPVANTTPNAAITQTGTAETQLEMPGLSTPPDSKLSTWNRELSEYGIASPADKSLNKTSDKTTIQRIIDKGLQASKATTPGSESQPDKADAPGADTTPSKPGAPGTEKRALPVSETKAEAPGLDTQLLAAMQDAQQQIPADILREAGAVYPVWRGQVAEREIKPSKRDGFKFISAQLCRGRKRTLTPASMVKLLGIWQLRAVADGILKPNPNQRSGAAKFLLIG